ncbi:DUF4105 domain-containing protein [Ramlibacter sp. G-1-2-2]|uniref:DUF4105 domain-containing protein n=1 Tax=Ramlibacter agri TaxID=2728837 RepID=A0A848HB86_9BURK|nr:DUF4105 domain-containing protein [Ramlibacter agri]NML47744.1 DUF4105 domain-containing protein [Ramlibacter agri]
MTPQPRPRSRVASIFRGLWRVLLFLVAFACALWATLAIYYSNLPWPWARIALAVAFAGFSFWSLRLARRRGPRLAFAVLFLAVVIWEISIPPSNTRTWRPDVAVTPRAFVSGDRVRIAGVRDFSFGATRDDFTVRYLEREVQLSHLASVDLLISYWGTDDGPVAHTFLSFNFDNAEPLSISIEARPEYDEGYNPIASMFKQFELIYVVGEERDLVGSRVKQRGEAVFLYPIRADAEGVRRLFLVYTQRINELADHPEWYSLLKSNCTLNVLRYARSIGWASGFDIRHYLNGWVDRYLFATGILGSALPFRELRAHARVREEVQPGEDAADYSRRIRRDLAPNP